MIKEVEVPYEWIYEKEIHIEKEREVHVEKIIPKYVERVVENPRYVDNIVEIDEG